jgi:hypothetical protein
MTDPLPQILRHLRNDLGTIMNAIAEYERCTLREQWGALRADTQDRALKDIERRMQAACDRIGMMPAERWALQEQIQELRRENARLANANVDLLHGRAA